MSASTQTINPLSAVVDGRLGTAADQDPIETLEWLDSLNSVIAESGGSRALFLLRQLEEQARQSGLVPHSLPFSAYRNTIALEQQAPHPGDITIEERITAILRWNALAMVVRANKAYGDLGGHVASYASAAEIFETGFNHFFRSGPTPRDRDLVLFQPHSAPGIYARAFLEGRLSKAQLENYRQEVAGPGLCSYPHPWLMPDFWQVPTGSMGIGPISAIYQARFMRYLQHRHLLNSESRHVWGIFGDGEMDEPESIGALTLAAREKLDNLTFIINCNLQRLDGPVRGNGQIIQELEALFTGAGWHVIKVLWGSDWDALFARDTHHALLKQFASTVDGQYQTLGANDGDYNRDHFFKLDPDLQALVQHMTPQEITALRRGGHDLRKLYAAFAAALAHTGQPTVILAKTKKGFGMGGAGESRMVAHQQKKLDFEALRAFRDRFELPLTDAQVERLDFLSLADGSIEARYLQARRTELGGPLPIRSGQAPTIAIPTLSSYADFALQPNGKDMSTTMALVRLLSNLLKDKTLAPRIVPIVADEARTFGMTSLFRQIGIYAPSGQLYEPEDANSMLSYRESRDGQLLEEGITEAGALSSWTAAATAYSVHGLRMLPFYIYYSMFGFQRVGDLIWAAADQRARGFLIGATAGRTTLGGEGLQHQDGSSHVMAATIPNCRAYDPAFASEVAIILDHGMRRIMEQDHDEFYYLTVANENYAHQSIAPDQHDDVIKGMYRMTESATKPHIRLLGSGAILREVIAAADMLANDWHIHCELWSVTSFAELAREAAATQRWNRLHPTEQARASHLERCLPGDMPVIAATDYVRAYPQLIAEYLTAPYTTLGTDGFGRSDTRTKLRRFFEVDRVSIVISALTALQRTQQIEANVIEQALHQYGVTDDAVAPWQR